MVTVEMYSDNKSYSILLYSLYLVASLAVAAKQGELCSGGAVLRGVVVQTLRVYPRAPHLAGGEPGISIHRSRGVNILQQRHSQASPNDYFETKTNRCLLILPHRHTRPLTDRCRAFCDDFDFLVFSDQNANMAPI